MRRLFALLMFVPGALGAQTRTVISGYVASDAGVAGNPLLVGATAAKERGWFAARLGLGFDVGAPPSRDLEGNPLTIGIGTTDADGMLFLGSPRRNASLIPYGVAGVGMRAIQTDGRVGVAANYSYGIGFRAPLLAVFSMEGEARYRENIAELPSRADPVVRNGLEFRFGLSTSFGGGAGRTLPRPAPRSLPPRPTSTPASSPGSAARSRLISATLSSAERYIGVPYTWGGTTPEGGFDCSGFIHFLYQQQGVSLPRVSQDQARFGEPVPVDIRSMMPGDIIAFASNGHDVDHTALYAGAGRIIHSSSSGHGVRYDDLYSQRGAWYVDHMVAVRRVVGGSSISE